MQDTPGRAGIQALTPEILVSAVNSLGGFSLSPDGKTIAFSWKTTAGSQIYLTPINQFEPTQLTKGDFNKKWPCWSPGGENVAYIQDKDGNECYDLYTVSTVDGSIRSIINFQGSNFRGLEWSPGGCHLAFSSNWKGSFDIYTVQADGLNLRHLTSGSEVDVCPEWSPDGRRLLYASFLQGPEPQSKIRIINQDGSELCSIGPEGARNGGARWSPDGTQIAFSSNALGICNIGIIDVDTGDISWQTKEDDAVYLPIWSPDGQLLACLVDSDGNHQIAVTEIKTGRFRIVGPLDGLCSGHEFTPDSKALVFTHEGPRNPSDLWYLDLSSGKLRKLTDSCSSTLNRKRLVAPEVIHYSSFDNLDIPAFLYKPSDVDPDVLPPAIVWVHGGPNYQFMNKWNPTVQLLVSHGYLVLAPNFRGSTGYGKEFTQKSIGDWGGGDLGDIIAAADYLESTEQADGRRIGLFGGSYGGYLILMALAKAPERWAAGVDLYGFVNLETFYRSTQGWLREWIETQIGTPEENKEFYRKRSPITHCEDISAPLLIFQGANDARIPLSQSMDLMSMLKSHNKDCQLKVYEDEGHGFQKKDNQIDSMRTTLEFLRRHLCPNQHKVQESVDSSALENT